jgi:hypothetical protein
MQDDPVIAGHIADADRAEAQGNHAARSASATAALNAWAAAVHKPPSDAPRNASEASARLEHLNKSPEWRRDGPRFRDPA